MNNADLLVVFGASFSQHTGINPSIPTIQVDYDTITLGKFHAVTVPVYGEIAAGMAQDVAPEREGCVSIDVATLGIPHSARTFALRVRGDSMIDEGILDGDWVVIEHREQACNGEMVVLLVDGEEATLKRLERGDREIVLHPANSSLKPMRYHPDQVRVQGVLVGQMRHYH